MTKIFTLRALLLGVTLLAIIPCSAVNRKTRKAVPDEDQEIRFASLSEAQELIAQEDSYMQRLNQFNINLRLGRTGTKEELIEKQINACREFTEDEKVAITKCMNDINEYFVKTNSQISLPSFVEFVKTTQEEELDATGYTRGTTVFLPEDVGEMSDSAMHHLIAHEYFHVLSRIDPDFRSYTYDHVLSFHDGFMIDFPEDIQQCRLDNPDITDYDSYSEFNVNGEVIPCATLLYLDKDYTGNPLWAAQTRLIPLGEGLQPIQKDGATIMYQTSEASDFEERMQSNSGYALDPEEVLAENFAFLVTETSDDLPDQDLLTRLKVALGQTYDGVPEGIEFDGLKSVIYIDDFMNFYFKMYPEGVRQPLLDFSVSDPEVMSVKRSYYKGKEEYTYTALKEGTCTITFWCKDYPDVSVSTEITVVDSKVIVNKDFTGENISTSSINWKDGDEIAQFIQQYIDVDLDPDYSFKCEPSNPDKLGFKHYDCQQTYYGIASENDIIIHTDANGRMLYMTGQAKKDMGDSYHYDDDDDSYGEDSYGEDENQSKTGKAPMKLFKQWSKLFTNAEGESTSADKGTETVKLNAVPYYYGGHMKESEILGSKDSQGNYILQIPGKLYTLNFTNNIWQLRGINSAENLASLEDAFACGENFTSKTADFAESVDIKSKLKSINFSGIKNLQETNTYNLEIKKCKFSDLGNYTVADSDTVTEKKTFTVNKYLLPAISKGAKVEKAQGNLVPVDEENSILSFITNDVQFTTPCREKDTENEVGSTFYSMVLTTGNDTIVCNYLPNEHCDNILQLLNYQTKDTIVVASQRELITCQPAIDIHWGLQRTLDIYQQVFGINSFDDNGTPVIAKVNYTDDAHALPLNAVAEGTAADKSCGLMSFGMGSFLPYIKSKSSINSFGSYPLTSLDVMGHEFTHLVAHKLGNRPEALALNESYADIMGKTVERMSAKEDFYVCGNDNVEFVSWKLGQLTGAGTPQTVGRRFDDPNIDSQPKFYRGKYWEFMDADMHANAGVQNHWFYLLCNGGTVTPEQGESVSITAIPRDSAEFIAFATLKYFGINRLNYSLARKYSIRAAELYYGKDSKEVQSVFNAWYAVGVDQDEWKPGDPTSLDEIANNPQESVDARKCIDNGQIVIIKNGIKYNAAGQRVE